MPFPRGNAAKGFFALFYDWSLVNCIARRPLHVFPNPRIRITLSRRAFSPRAREVCHSTDSKANGSSEPASPEEPALSSHLRQIMRKMPHSVVVATSTAASPDRGAPPRFKGMTVSSFTTLTLTPTPIVTFNIRRPSQTLNAISESKQFLIHILSATESGVRVADAFTKGNGRDVFRNEAFEVLRRRGSNITESLDPPLLAADGITKVLRCQVLGDQGLVEVGDHVLILGKVMSIIEPAPRKDANVEERGLCYLDREYRQVGAVIELPRNELAIAA